jgi:beta-phosphoglucomutase
MAKIKGLIFDLDGTLTLTQQFHAQALHEVFLNDYGIEYTQKEDQEKYSGKPSKHTCEMVLKEHGKHPTTEEIEKCAARKKEVYDKILAKSEIIAVKGIEDFLKKAKANGLKLIVATGNKVENTKIILKRAGIAEYFNDEIVGQADVKNHKPAPDIFLHAAKTIGLKPEDCVVFEDSLNGVQAAASAKIKCIGLTTAEEKGKLMAAGATETIADYTDEKLNKIFT